jgi:uncharacterized protein YbcI
MDEAASGAQPGTDADRREKNLADVSNAMVRLYKDLFGRGPTKARTTYATPDLIVSTLERSLTRPEQHMADVGDHERLRDLRSYFQHQHAAEFIDAVESITGRKVRGFVSGIDAKRDISAELFYLEPRG